MLNTTFKLKYNISFSLEEINTHKVPFFKPYTLEETITSQQDDQDNQVYIIPEQFCTIAMTDVHVGHMADFAVTQQR